MEPDVGLVWFGLVCVLQVILLAWVIAAASLPPVFEEESKDRRAASMMRVIMPPSINEGIMRTYNAFDLGKIFTVGIQTQFFLILEMRIANCELRICRERGGGGSEIKLTLLTNESSRRYAKERLRIA